jgi:tRNA-2-methylthio-N6-dimethylallyladenosine synthase
MKKRYLYLETYGCQMNEYDSSRIRSALGMELTNDPQKADVLIINTCAIREKADQKALSSLGKFKRLKLRKPDTIIGVGGCMAQLYGEKLIDHIPHLDIVFGTRNISALPKLISQVQNENKRKVEISFDVEEIFDVEPLYEAGKVTTFVSVQQGCNKTCSYCIVPRVRGKEVNRPVSDILREAANFAQKGVKEITLIGQTVNSWKSDCYRFADLLRIVSDIEELLRIRFTTSYPRDVTKKLVNAIRDIPKVCRHIHLPVQSGSNRVLKMMERTYTREWYIDAVCRLRDAVPDIAITTDIIVGFPGETEEDFNDTTRLLRDVEFDGTFSFKFSPRPGTPATEFSDMVSDEVASRRLFELQEFQREISMKKNLNSIGQIEEILVEGESKNDTNWASGRTTHNRIVNFPGTVELKGKLVNVEITEGFQNSLRGRMVEKS